MSLVQKKEGAYVHVCDGGGGGWGGGKGFLNRNEAEYKVSFQDRKITEE